CAKTKTEDIDPINHKWGEWEVITPATCTEDGVETRTCKNDKTHTETRKIEATNHDWGEWKVTTPATCTEDGVETRTCKNDKTHTETRPIEATNHDWSDWKVTTPATCTEDGVETRTCKNDSSHTETHPIEATDHEWGEWEVTTPATCTEDGVETRTCKNDSTHTETRKIPATGKHTYATTITKAKPGKDGSIVKKCTVCGKVESKTAISAPKKIVLSKTAYIYSGKAKNPTVTVKDAAGKTISSSNYTVSYATTRKSIGTHKVTVTFKGSKYEGSLSAKFVINPKAPSIKSASNLVKGVKVTWKPVSGITGYQIQLSTNKSFKNSKIISASKTATSKKITGLSTGTVSKKYYVRVRTYKKVSGNWYYSDWSSAKSAHAVKKSK
ncbi:MAG: fibronectin type III domain-containing protein, partial [Clostridiales bacterium]|nr:fibronectin type III domain-containing protein [Clostridiales bacterium]